MRLLDHYCTGFSQYNISMKTANKANIIWHQIPRSIVKANWNHQAPGKYYEYLLYGQYNCSIPKQIIRSRTTVTLWTCFQQRWTVWTRFQHKSMAAERAYTYQFFNARVVNFTVNINIKYLTEKMCPLKY